MNDSNPFTDPTPSPSSNPSASLDPDFSQRVTTKMKSSRPWAEFFAGRTRYSIPKAKEVLPRLKENIIYFQTNYVVIFLVLCVYCVLTSPLLFISFVFVVALWCYFMIWRTAPVTIGTYVVLEKHKTMFLSAVTVVVFYYSSVGPILFWLLNASVTIVLMHAILYTPQSAYELELSFGSL
eukprot:TRINITY_DN3653_c0_g1_i1.p1 TRINITY_DN3653_c0_g1~~TRINITY_DN3653_c0_g1_i1.p1  ORF type:complete len:180 (-),score=15.93 TRINITY_DN3653_c0_g1_i1:44-583(-)